MLWSFWFIAFLPCSIITVLAAWGLTLWLYPPEKVALEGGYEYLRMEIAKMGPWSALEKKAALVMTVAILLWLTDFIHHISPAVIGMGVGLFALLPRVGILDIEELKRLNYLPVFFVAAAVSMGTVLEVTKALVRLIGRIVWRLTQTARAYPELMSRPKLHFLDAGAVLS